MPSIIYKKSVEGFGIALYRGCSAWSALNWRRKDGGAPDAIEHE